MAFSTLCMHRHTRGALPPDGENSITTKMQKSICRRALQFPFSPFSCFWRRTPRCFSLKHKFTPAIFLFTSPACHEICYKIFSAPSAAPVSFSMQPSRNPDLNFKSVISIPPKSLAPTLTTQTCGTAAITRVFFYIHSHLPDCMHV